MPKTGIDILQSPGLTVHEKAIVIGASAVFMQDLCKDMYSLQALVDEEQAHIVARACACRALKSEKCGQLEHIVTQVLDSDDGMPEIENQELLAEILSVYGDTVRAENNGTSDEHMKEVVVPNIVEQAYRASGVYQQSEEAFISEMQKYADEWEDFQPCTGFQRIVYDAINNICI